MPSRPIRFKAFKAPLLWMMGTLCLLNANLPAQTTFFVSGGNFSAPYYDITDETGISVDLTSYPFEPGNTYLFMDVGAVSYTHLTLPTKRIV